MEQLPLSPVLPRCTRVVVGVGQLSKDQRVDWEARGAVVMEDLLDQEVAPEEIIPEVVQVVALIPPVKQVEMAALVSSF